MASNITLSAGVRQNLLSLQSTANMMSLTQNRLATGKKVNSALDNPSAFFTSQSLSNRSSDLSGLLDSINQAQQTLKAADTGITSLTKLVESAKSLAKQAQQSSAPAATYSHAITGSAIDADVAATATSTNAFAATVTAATASVQSSLVIDATDIANDTADGDTISITYNGTTTVFESDEAGNGVAGSNVAFTNAASLVSALETAFGADNVSNASGTVTIAGSFTNSFTTASSGTGSALLGTNTAAVDGDVLTIASGANSASFRKVGAGDEDAAAGTFSDLATLQAALAASTVTGVTLSVDSGNLQVDGGSFTIGGDLGADLGFATTAYNTTNATLGAITANSTLTITVGSGETETFTFSATTTRADLGTWLSGLDLGSGVSASVNTDGEIEIAQTGAATATEIVIGGSAAAALGLNTGTGATTGTYVPTGAVATSAYSATRTTYENQFNDLLKQIDTLASDSSYNGVNLLNGDDLKVIFNEDGSSSLTIKGVKFDSESLGLDTLAAGDFQSNSSIDTVLANVDAALNSLRSQAAQFGSNLTTVQTRQDFTKNMINTLQVGSDALVLADTNEEGANLLALQTRQQLSTTALSLSAQADQAVLRLF